MNSDVNSGRNQEKVLFLKFAGLLSVIPILWVMFYLSGKGLCKRGDLADSDCYLRLLRVEALHGGGPWYDPVFLRINPPHGQTSHWTRPFDVLLLLGALPISLFTNFRSALFWWGVVSGPILMFVTIIALQWATRPILGSKGSLAVGFLYLGQATLWACFQPGRPDHQSFLIFLFALSVGLTLRMIIEPFNTRLCLAAGLVAALAMWVSVESMIPVCITLAVLVALWILKDGDVGGRIFYYALALTVGMAVSLLAERSWHTLLTEEYDRLSVVHLGLFGIITLLWIVISALNRYADLFGKRTNRLLSAPVCAAFVTLAMLLLFPRFYQGPFADMDSRLLPIYQQRIAELIPLVSKHDLLIILIQIVASIVICLPFFAWVVCSDAVRRLLSDRGSLPGEYALTGTLQTRVHGEGPSIVAQDASERTPQTARDGVLGGWVYVLLAVVVFSAAAIFQYCRWAYYAQTALVIPMTGFMNRVLAWRRFCKSEILKAIRNVLIKLVFVFGPLALGVAAEILANEETKPPSQARMKPFCEYLDREDRWQGRQLRILADVFEGAEIIYRTPHEVMGTPHATGTSTRNGQGILDTYNIMTAGTDQEALELIRKRVIDLIVLRPQTGEPQFYSNPERESTFYRRLSEDAVPDWLRKVELPADLSESFLLFEVNR